MELVSRTPSDLLKRVDSYRFDASRGLDRNSQVLMGQFFTPPSTARLMASMFCAETSPVHLLDAGAGVGSLSAAYVAEMCGRDRRPSAISITAYEIDPRLVGYLHTTFALCRRECEQLGIAFDSQVFQDDFIEVGVTALRRDFFAKPLPAFDSAILNPPYRKIQSASRTRSLLRSIGVETTNLYTGFLSIVIQVLRPGGQLVAITPRSFCNGPYFRPFRKLFLETMSLRRIHIFGSRDRAFREDEVLQENIIFHAVKGAGQPDTVVISSSVGPDDDESTFREVEYTQVVRPTDPDSFIHIVPDEHGASVTDRISRFTTSLDELGIAVSTGRVVDFRAAQFLRQNPGRETAPLIYPSHFDRGTIIWPKAQHKKPNAIAVSMETLDLLVPAGTYVLVKRFSAKEERRRIVAAIYDPHRLPAPLVGFENHLNYFHAHGQGLPTNLARGLAAFLNSSLIDAYFRQFNGHTQVNAADLRKLRYPNREELEALGQCVGDAFLAPEELDRRVAGG